ncbi:MAG: DUF4390 domain-containing protein [Gammaproteobacteria bacterium]|nr:DUF4390 domain-containing protein [Gammaproteobacteria bacterium]
MRDCEKPEPNIAPLCLLLLAIFVSCPAIAEFQVSNIEPRLTKTTLHVTGILDLGLSDKAEEALSKGIPLDIVIDLSLSKKRTFLWNDRISMWIIRRNIRYHALSGQYLVIPDASESDKPAIESFSSLQEAMAQVGNLDFDQLELSADKLQGDNDYVMDVRAYLDIARLPAPLRPVAYTSPAWHLNSGWTQWNVLR